MKHRSYQKISQDVQLKKGVVSISIFALLEREVAGKDTVWYQEEEQRLRPRRYPMPVPILCLDEEMRQFAECDIEVLFGDGKEELGLDQYQLMSARAIVRLLSPGDAGLCILGRRTPPKASAVATPCHHW